MSTGRRLAGKVAVVTGGASGMGASHVRSLASEGATVAIADIASDAGTELAQELRAAGHEASSHRLDVSEAGRSRHHRQIGGDTTRLQPERRRLGHAGPGQDHGPVGPAADQPHHRLARRIGEHGAGTTRRFLDLDRPVAQVLGPAGHAAPLGLPSGRVAEEDSLHVPVRHHTAPFGHADTVDK